MGELIPIRDAVELNQDILIDVYMGLNDAAKELGYSADRIGWLKRMESVLNARVHTDYVEFTEGLWKL